MIEYVCVIRNKLTAKMAIDIDAVLQEIGEFGPFQRRTFLLLCLPSILVGCSNLSYVFLAATPRYR